MPEPLPTINLDKNIFEEMGMGDISEERKQKLLETMTAIIMNRVAARALDLLTKEEQKEFDEFLIKEDNEGANEFMKRKMPNFEEIVAEETIIYKLEMIGQTKEFLKPTE